MNDAALGRELIARAEAMIPTLRERAPQDDKNGFTSKDTFREFREAGFTRIAQPKRYGGLELPLSVPLVSTHMLTAESLARVQACLSSGEPTTTVSRCRDTEWPNLALAAPLCVPASGLG